MVEACVAIGAEEIDDLINLIRKRQRAQSLEEIAKFVNPFVRGWVNYYGRFYKSALTPVLRELERSLAETPYVNGCSGPPPELGAGAVHSDLSTPKAQFHSERVGILRAPQGSGEHHGFAANRVVLIA